jgi:outer membrane protein assembly factor BamB
MGAVIAGDTVLATLPPDHLAAFRIADGREIWRIELRPAQPIVAGDSHAYVTAGDVIHAVRLEDGVIAWRRPSGALAAPLLAHQGWIIASTADSLAALREADGSLVWQQASVGQTERATIDGNMLYVPYSDGRIVAFDLATGKPRWERKLGGAPSEILAAGGRLYVGAADRLFYCLDADKGDEAWRRRAGAVPRGRPAADARHVYLTGLDNVLRALDRGSGVERWQASLPFRPWAGPVLIGSVVLVPGPAPALSTFVAESGRPYTPIPFGAPLLDPPAFAATDQGPVAAAVTGGLTEEWTLSVLEQSTTIPVLPLVPPLHGLRRALPTLPPVPAISWIPLKVLPGVATPLPAVPGRL